MSEQHLLRRRIAAAKRIQAERIRVVEQQKKDLDAVIEFHDRKIANLEAQLTIGVAR